MRLVTKQNFLGETKMTKLEDIIKEELTQVILGIKRYNVVID